ncbi:MAG TPA: Dyp-type peroxidase, partial [Allocoleopsis sp.]
NETDLNNIVNELKSTVPNGLVLIHEDIGRTRNDLPGHEHFGFKDGISQPGIRGRLSTSNELFTPRLIDSANPLSVDFSRPGQPLVYPGQFVFGYPTQRKRDSRTPGDEAKAGPDWCTNGSFLVYRRLRQDVPLFWRTMKSEAERLSQLEQANLDAVHLASILVGRWRSGTPISRSLMVDIPEMEKDKTGALNNFAFVDKTKTVDDSFSSKLPFRSDSIGNICPFAAHIRKVNPRDGSTDQGPPETTLQFRILRRGIPFGTPIADPFNPTEEELRVERGLLFLCYQTSIENQFEFLSQTWMNSLKNPQSTDPGSFDMIVGLNNQDSNGRTAAFYPSGSSTPVAVTTTANWITPTGGGYFFAPSISALRDQIVK